MTIKGHVDTIIELMTELDNQWSTTGWKAKVTWLSMVQKLAKELEQVAMAEEALDGKGKKNA